MTIFASVAVILLGSAMIACEPVRLVAPLHLEPRRPTPDEPFRELAPGLPPIVDAVDPPPHETQLPNGVRVLLFPRHGMPLVAVRLVIDRGAVDVDDAGGRAVSEMVNLFSSAGGGPDEGSRSARDAQPGASWRLESTPDNVTIVASAPSSGFDATLAIVGRVAVARLDAATYETRAAEWQRWASAKPIPADAAERAILFGASHAYGWVSPRGPVITLDVAQAIHDRLFQPAHATLIVVGDVTSGEVDASATLWLGVWPPGSPLPRVQTPPPVMNGPRVATATGALRQIHVSVFSRGPVPASEDATALQVASQVLTGSTASQLFVRLRESGDAYISTAATPVRRVATWMSFGGSFESDRALDGVRKVLESMKDLREGRVPESEIALARESLIAAWRRRMSTVSGTAGAYAESLSSGSGSVRDYPSRVARVRSSDVVRVAKEYLRPNALHVVAIEDTRYLNLESLDMGGSVELDLSK